MNSVAKGIVAFVGGTAGEYTRPPARDKAAEDRHEGYSEIITHQAAKLMRRVATGANFVGAPPQSPRVGRGRAAFPAKLAG
jgi:hypothetical protein